MKTVMLVAGLACCAAIELRPSAFARRLAVRGGDDALTGAAFSSAMKRAEGAIVEIEAAMESRPFEGELGALCDAVFGAGVEEFARLTASLETVERSEALALFQSALDARLELLFVKQLGLVRAQLLSSGSTDATALDVEFRNAATTACRTGASWDHESERASLAAVAGELSVRADRASAVGAKAQQQQQSYMQLFQMYQAQIQQLQQAAQQAPPQFSMAYRVPDTDMAVSATKQADRTTLTLGCVSDDTAPLLGPNGFVKGLTAANIGLTVNVHV